MAPLTDGGVICLCSRGLIHSRTIRSIESARRNAGPGDWALEIEDEYPIPLAQNVITARVLQSYPEARWLLFIEEDIVVPSNLFRLFNSDPIQAMNYKLPGGCESIRRSQRFPNKILFAGLGCTLIQRAVFDDFEDQWFSTGYQFTELDGELVPVSATPTSYGGHDIFFCYHAARLGYPVRQVPKVGMVPHLRVTALGEPGKNDGVHRIEAL